MFVLCICIFACIFEALIIVVVGAFNIHKLIDLVNAGGYILIIS